MGFLDTDLDEVRAFLDDNGYPDMFVSYDGPWRDYEAYEACPFDCSSSSEQEVFVLEYREPYKTKFRLYKGILPSHPVVSDDTSLEDLTTNQMLCNRHYVDRIDCIGKESFEDWSIDAYLCGKMGPGDYRPEIDLALLDYSDIQGLKLNGLEGEHYGYELFLKPRRYWPLRGAPFFWCEMARELTDDILPLADDRIDEVVQTLKTEYGIPESGEEWILVPKYRAGIYSGMSSGALCANGINELRDEIKQRNLLYGESPRTFVEEFVMRFNNFPYL